LLSSTVVKTSSYNLYASIILSALTYIQTSNLWIPNAGFTLLHYYIICMSYILIIIPLHFSAIGFPVVIPFLWITEFFSLSLASHSMSGIHFWNLWSTTSSRFFCAQLWYFWYCYTPWTLGSRQSLQEQLSIDALYKSLHNKFDTLLITLLSSF
jgi:hypothetical protein